MIGIFDSGVGGLTVYKEVRKKAPNADIVYFGDTQNAPYGNKTKEEVEGLTSLAIQKLIENGATEIVSACNSVSVLIAASLFEKNDNSLNSLIEMVNPVVESFKKSHEDDNILLLATKITIESDIYQKGFANIGKSIDTLIIPELAGAIESGSNNEIIESIIEESLRLKDIKKINTLILGCTHYPLVQEIFKKILGGSVTIYDPAFAVAKEVVKKFDTAGSGTTTFLFSKENKITKKYIRDFDK